MNARSAEGQVLPAGKKAGARQQPAGADWTDYGGTTLNQRYDRLTQINDSNVGKLRVAWHAHLNDPPAASVYSAQEAGGLAIDGVYYTSDGCDDVYALDGASGKLLWQYESGLPEGVPPGQAGSAAGMLMATRPCMFNRGLTSGAGMIYIEQLNGDLVALDEHTGAAVWKRPYYNPEEGYYAAGAPQYADGLVFAGAAGGETGTRGFVAGFDAATGKEAWRFWTVPQKGDPAAASWGKGSKLGYGGGDVWVQPEVDPALGLLYVPTANASPYSRRPKGDDLYTASIVALHIHTGKLAWYYQLVHHDEWDDDTSAESPVLFDAEIDGAMRFGLDEPTKMGYNFLLDRGTGEPLTPTPEVRQPQSPGRPDDSETQPIPRGERFSPRCASASGWRAAGGPSKAPDGKPFVFGCVYTPMTAGHYTVAGWHDAADWPPSSYDQQTKMVYVCATTNRGEAFEPSSEKKVLTPHAFYTGAVDEVAGDWVKGKIGKLIAIRVSDNKIAWQKQLPDGNGCYTGTATTAGGLVFVGEYSGHELAYSASTGKLLWTSPKMETTLIAPPIVYSAGGKEYVTVLDGGATVSAASTHGNSVYSFALP